MRVSRIGIDARLLGYRKGGIAEYTRQLVLALANLDTQTDYVILHRLHDTATYSSAQNFKRVDAFTPAHHRFERFTLSLELSPRRLDLLHSPDFIPPDAERGGILSRFTTYTSSTTRTFKPLIASAIIVTKFNGQPATPTIFWHKHKVPAMRLSTCWVFLLRKSRCIY